MLATGIHC